MNLYASTVLADHYDDFHHAGWFPWPIFLIIPLIFWATFVFFAVTGRRRFRGRTGESTLRDTYAKGEIDETEYRTRLAVLRETRR